MNIAYNTSITTEAEVDGNADGTGNTVPYVAMANEAQDKVIELKLTDSSK